MMWAPDASGQEREQRHCAGAERLREDAAVGLIGERMGIHRSGCSGSQMGLSQSRAGTQVGFGSLFVSNTLGQNPKKTFENMFCLGGAETAILELGI